MQEVNVKVAVRVRPLLPKEKLGGEQNCVRSAGNPNQLILGSDRPFTFDHVFWSKSSQDEIYNMCVQPLVHSLFDGYNATVFAYGQTGSGKTFTIGGGDITTLTEDDYGIIPRAIHSMFQLMKENPTRTFTVAVSYIEIYMEELRDLLDLDTSPKDLHVREDSKGNTVIVGAREVECETLDEVMSFLEAGSAARHTGSTQMNEQSSRSHSIFTIVVGQKWQEVEGRSQSCLPDGNDANSCIDEEDMSHYMSGKFHFVDLAGSERAHKTGNIGDRFKESIFINSGLLSLGNVISALGDSKRKSTHIPYRDSKITRLLKDSLGGNAKTLMICCISPSSSNFDESLNSLKYANRAKNIKNKPIINRDIQSIRFEEMQSEIKALREELARQRSTVMSIYGDSDTERVLQDANFIKEMEEKITRLQTECAHYRMIAEEAYKHIVDIQGKDALSRSQHLRLKDWMDLLEEIKNKVPMTLSREELQNDTIRSLQSELQKCRSHLESDETIFADKTREVAQLQDSLKEMEMNNGLTEIQLQEMGDENQKQGERLLSQQMRIEELEAALKMNQLRASSMDATASLPSTVPSRFDQEPPRNSSGGQRPKSVPAHIHKQQGENLLRPPSRLIKTSPALFTLDRVMQSFRARSQLLVSRLEDSDDVLHQTFSDDNDDNDDDDIDDGDETDEREDTAMGDIEARTSLRKNAKVKRRGTFQVKRDLVNKNSSNNNNDEPRSSFSDHTNGPEDIRCSTHLLAAGGSMSRESSQSRLINMDVDSSAEIHRKKIKQSQLRALEANQKIRDLSINIRMKEQLIKELVKSEKDAEVMNKQYAEKIKALEKEKQAAKRDLSDVQRALASLETRDKAEATNMQKMEMDYRKKIEDAKAKVSALQRKQKETEKVASFAHQNEKKIHDLELAIERMKQQQDSLHKKYKDEVDQKAKIEREMQREVQRVKDLEIRDEQTQKILKRKNEELASAKRRLRSASGVLPPITSEEQEKLEEQRKWLDSEVEKVLEQRRRNEDLEQELQRREGMLVKKEAVVAQKSELELKKMRSSKSLNKSIVSLSMKLDTVEKKIEEKKQELPEASDNQRSQVKEEIVKLRQAREKLNKQRASMDAKLCDGKVLTMEEERSLLEMDEAIEALDAAIQYKDDTIHARQMEVRQSQQALIQSEQNLVQRLNSLSPSETRNLLSRYFDKVVGLRDSQRKLQLQCSEMEVKTDEQDRLIKELQSALTRAGLELDRKMTGVQRDYEQKMQLLMHQINDAGSEVNGVMAAEAHGKFQELEKNLFYYKKKFRDSRTKIKDLIVRGLLSPKVAEEVGLVSASMDAESVTPRPNHHHHQLQQHLHHNHHSSNNNNNHHSHSVSNSQRDVTASRENARRNSTEDRTTTPNASPHPHNTSSSLSSRQSQSHHSQQHPYHHSNQNHQDPHHHSSSPLPHPQPHQPHQPHSPQDRPSPSTSVKISKRDLRPMTNAEVSMRRSNLSSRSSSATTPRDSLEDGGGGGGNNPWS